MLDSAFHFSSASVCTNFSLHYLFISSFCHSPSLHYSLHIHREEKSRLFSSCSLSLIYLFHVFFIIFQSFFFFFFSCPQRREIEAAFWFTVLLNLKHIFLYLAPAYFIYLLRSYVIHGPPSARHPSLVSQVFRLVKLGVVVAAVFALSFAPFVLRGQLVQVVSRLFPFRRGLSHAYWAPNFWALYNFADKLLILIGESGLVLYACLVLPNLVTDGLKWSS